MARMITVYQLTFLSACLVGATPLQAADEVDVQIAAVIKERGGHVQHDADGYVVTVYLGQKADDDLLGMLPSLRRLRDLDLETAKGVTQVGLSNLPMLGGLERLSLYEMNLQDDDLRFVADLTDLKDLNLSSNQLTDAGLAQLSKLTSLEVLDIRQTSYIDSKMQITDAGLVHLAGLSKLRLLEFAGTQITPGGLLAAKSFENLEALVFAGDSIDDDGLAKLHKFPRLKRLGLSFTSVTDEGIKHLEDLPQLENLSLNSNKITAAGIKHLAALTEVEYLELRCTLATNESLAVLKEMSKLEMLHLYASSRPHEPSKRISAEGLAHIAALPHLKSLSIHNMHLGAEEVETLSTMKQLAHLTLMRTDANDKAVTALRKALPDAHLFSHGYDGPSRMGRFQFDIF